MNVNAFAATHDVLTHLPNKFLLLDRLNHAVVISERSRVSFALLIITINNYSEIIDEHGKKSSDDLILQVTERLLNALREPDTIARGEDNTFVILLPEVTNDFTLIKLISRIKKTLIEPFLINSNRINLSISIGQGMYPFNGTNALKLFKYVESEIQKKFRR